MTKDEETALDTTQIICLRLGFHLLKAEFNIKDVTDAIIIFTRDGWKWKVIRATNKVTVLADNQQILGFNNGNFFLGWNVYCEEADFWARLKELIE